MEMLQFPLLREDQIEVRVGQDRGVGKGCSLLLYKDARCDMAILDKAVGPENWQRKHYECKGNLFCSVGIRFPDGWVWKDDCGAETNVEKEKGGSFRQLQTRLLLLGDRQGTVYRPLPVGERSGKGRERQDHR